MTRKGGSRVNAKKYCFSFARKTLGAAALTGGLGTSGAASHLNQAKFLARKMSYFNYFGLLKHMGKRGGGGGRYTQPVANPKNSKVKFPSAYILVKTAPCVKLPYLKNVSKSCGHPLLFTLPSMQIKKKNCFQEIVRLVGREAGVGRGCLGRKHLTGKFQQRGSICTRQPITPFQH